MRLRILDLNAWHGLYARSWVRVEKLETEEVREGRFRSMVEGIRALEPDVIALQECWPQPAFSGRLAELLGFEHVGQVSNAGFRIFGTGYPLGVETGEGSAILARPGLGLRSLGRTALSGFGFTGHRLSLQVTDKRMALACQLEVEGQRLVVATFHVRYDFSTFEGFEGAWASLRERGLVSGEPPAHLVRSTRANMLRRDAELETLASWIEELAAAAPVVLVGDLNIDGDAPQVLAFAERLGLVSALDWAGEKRPTWDPANNPNIGPSAAFVHPDGKPKSVANLVAAWHDQLAQTPDHAFVPRAWEGRLVEARIVLDQPFEGVLASDHYGVLVTLSL